MIHFRGKRSNNLHTNITRYHIFTTNSTPTFLEFKPAIRSEKKGSNQLSCGIEIGI